MKKNFNSPKGKDPTCFSIDETRRTHFQLLVYVTISLRDYNGRYFEHYYWILNFWPYPPYLHDHCRFC